MTKYEGAEIEPRTMKTFALFDAAVLLRKEIERRAWLYLREIGYSFYKQGDINVTRFRRGEIDIINIIADGQISWQDRTVNVEVPEKQFNAVTAEDNNER